MIEVQILKKCKICNSISKIEKIYINDKTSEEEFLIKEYVCTECGYVITDKEYINYILDKSVFTK